MQRTEWYHHKDIQYSYWIGYESCCEHPHLRETSEWQRIAKQDGVSTKWKDIVKEYQLRKVTHFLLEPQCKDEE